MHDDLWKHIILKAVVGSRAHGLSTDASDTDRRGIYLPPATRHWSLAGVPEQLESDETQETYFELRKFITLALKSNPVVLETLHSPMVEYATPFARKLIASRRIFLSKRIHDAYTKYAQSQFAKLHAGLRKNEVPKPKHVMHLLRLLIAGTEALRTGELPVRVGEEHRQRLIAARDGRLPFEEADAWRVELHAAFDRALVETSLPDEPDTSAADALLIEGRRIALDGPLSPVPGGEG